MTQAPSIIAKKLGLPRKDNTEDGMQASLKARDWLNTSGQFLLIFDNADNIDILSQVWPANGKASILVTTRSPQLRT